MKKVSIIAVRAIGLVAGVFLATSFSQPESPLEKSSLTARQPKEALDEESLGILGSVEAGRGRVSRDFIEACRRVRPQQEHAVALNGCSPSPRDGQMVVSDTDRGAENPPTIPRLGLR